MLQHQFKLPRHSRQLKARRSKSSQRHLKQKQFKRVNGGRSVLLDDNNNNDNNNNNKRSRPFVLSEQFHARPHREQKRQQQFLVDRRVEQGQDNNCNNCYICCFRAC